jgi:hypothetical protein
VVCVVEDQQAAAQLQQQLLLRDARQLLPLLLVLPGLQDLLVLTWRQLDDW